MIWRDSSEKRDGTCFYAIIKGKMIAVLQHPESKEWLWMGTQPGFNGGYKDKFSAMRAVVKVELVKV